ncbi:hypothetical protein Emed_007670 [Eimeria media]
MVWRFGRTWGQYWKHGRRQPTRQHEKGPTQQHDRRRCRARGMFLYPRVFQSRPSFKHNNGMKNAGNSRYWHASRGRRGRHAGVVAVRRKGHGSDFEVQAGVLEGWGSSTRLPQGSDVTGDHDSLRRCKRGRARTPPLPRIVTPTIPTHPPRRES